MNLFKKSSYIVAVLVLTIMAQSRIVAKGQETINSQPEIHSVELASSGEAMTASAEPQITLPTDSLPVVWQKVKNFERVAEGPVDVPFWQTTHARTSIFGVNAWKTASAGGNFYSIAASNKIGPVTAGYWGNHLYITFYNAKVSLKKSQTEYPNDPAVSRIGVHTLSDPSPQAVQMAFELKSAAKDFVIRLDELGERVLVEMITNAVSGIQLKADGEEEVLTVESLKPVKPNVKRGADNSLEIEIPSTQSLLRNQEAFVNAKYISRMGVTGQVKGKTVITVWMKDNVEFAPEGQSIRFFPKKTQNLKYSYGLLVLKKPENFQMEKTDYILDVHNRKASLAFPHSGYIDGSYWIADSFITKIETRDGRMEFTFPEVYELTVAEDRDNVYITAKKPKEIFTKVVFIDIGHGGNDPGAVRRVDLGNGYREYTEKEANFAVAMLLREKLKQSPEIKAYFSRLTDSNPSAYTRAKLANEVGADFFLSLHNNMTTVKDRKIEGTDIYYLAGRKKGNLTAENLAKVLLKNYAAKTSFTNRIMHSAPHLYMVKYPQMPAAIVESGFMSDDGDLRKMFDPLEQEKTAEALYHSILEAFGYLQVP